jgi:hypothetical protein
MVTNFSGRPGGQSVFTEIKLFYFASKGNKAINDFIPGCARAIKYHESTSTGTGYFPAQRPCL